MQSHDTDVLSLVAGLLFTLLGVAFLLETADVLTVDGDWVLPAILIAGGVAGVLAARPNR